MSSRVRLIIKMLTVGQMAENCYLLVDPTTRDAFIVDPGDDPEYIVSELQKDNAHPIRIIATHGHFDHIMGAFALQAAFRIPFSVHKRDEFLVENMNESAKHFLGLTHVDPPPKISEFLHDDEVLSLGHNEVRVLHTPGHTPGSICLLVKESDALIVGDTIFASGGVGRTDFSYSDSSQMASSIKKILTFPSSFSLYSGHGTPTTIRAERVFYDA
ncbi:hypothetical protein A2Z00_02165 [Candidatus Gottesmanbacteria bacterium RBG_13_45_10]|uniref:Metallo-beta-lactamase domain-containing protein n=1 Tax=Candidatus Gottesmanbacteria bacterium RBG_13_45_10 TaxID=1798370 RepID=A0A1F5ZFQ8_9BACT|nr:MAG: hypothetical protein A2Z00_02165 [Candidatus Gottesmanbacteria bacterium RBG_13_45_10]